MNATTARVEFLASGVYGDEAEPVAGWLGENQIPGADENERKLKNFRGLVLGCIDADFFFERRRQANQKTE